VGFAVGIAVFAVTHSPILLGILVLGAFQLYRSVRTPNPAYYDVPALQRVIMGAAYFGLLAVMALGMWVSEVPLHAQYGNDLTLSQGATVLFSAAALLFE
jgi:hypothetical protein